MDFREHDRLSEDGYLRKVISPCGELVLYNYTDKCTYDKYWNDITLNARGTVYEISTGSIVARAFPKFFNFEELSPVMQVMIINGKKFQAFEKMDGSLGIIYNHNGEWRVNTRGSFTSDQAIKAKEMLSSYSLQNVNPHFTLLVEIIYPENRIIVDYKDKEELVLIGAMCKNNNIECTYQQLKNIGIVSGLEVVKSFEFSDISELIEKQKSLGKMEEGFVVRFNDGFRCKFKSKEYMALAKIMSNMTPLNFWYNMKMGVVSKEMLIEIPEEFRADTDRIVNSLESKYREIYKEAQDEFEHVIKSVGDMTTLEEDRKNIGLWLKEHHKEIKHSGVIFPILLGNIEALDKYVMRLIKPSGNVI